MSPDNVRLLVTVGRRLLHCLQKSAEQVCINCFCVCEFVCFCVSVFVFVYLLLGNWLCWHTRITQNGESSNLTADDHEGKWHEWKDLESSITTTCLLFVVCCLLFVVVLFSVIKMAKGKFTQAIATKTLDFQSTLVCICDLRRVSPSILMLCLVSRLSTFKFWQPLRPLYIW